MKEIGVSEVAQMMERETGPTIGFATLDLLDEIECEAWTGRVMRLKPHWRRRNTYLPFFTLGIAAYIDAVEGAHLYRDEALLRENNAFIAEHFAPLLETVSAALSAHFGMPARLASQVAWPGFHIFLPHPVFSRPVASMHRDLQYRLVFPEREPEDDELFSFTLPLSTPQGSGLNLWPEGLTTPELVPYRNGQLVVHDGLIAHQAVLQSIGEVSRVTLQGHGIVMDNQRIELYW